MSLCFYEAIEIKASFNELTGFFVCLLQGYCIVLGILREAVLVIFKEALTPMVLQCDLKTVSDAF